MPDPNQQAEGQIPEAETTQQRAAKGQEPDVFPREYVEQLRKESLAYRKDREELERRLQEFEDKDRSESEKLAARLEQIEKERENVREELQKERRARVVAQVGLPEDFADRLRGDDEAELLQDAQRLSQLVAGNRPVQGGFGGGPRGSDAPTDPELRKGQAIYQALTRRG
jgi:hypothetical protein